MTILTPSKLQKFVRDYDYDITLEMAKQILELLDGCGSFDAEDIAMATDYIVLGESSRYASCFYSITI